MPWMTAAVRALAGIAVAGALLTVAAPPARAAPLPVSGCSSVRAANWLPARGVADKAGVVRVFAIQYKHELRHVTSYEAFRRKIFCLFADFVAPHLHPTRPNLVVFPEDAGLMAWAIGSRGAAARALAAGPTRGHPDLSTGLPFGAAQALVAIQAGYGGPLAYYRTVLAARQAQADPEAARDPERSFALADPRRMALIAATDTFVRGFMQTFSDLARATGTYVVSSSNQPDFVRSRDPADIAALADPDLLAAGKLPDHVWVARDARAWNQVFVWAPDPGQTAWSRRTFGPLPPDDPRSNLIHVNRKVPLTSIERDFLALLEGDMSPENTGPFTLPGVPGLRFAIANSLPAFMWGTGSAVRFGQPVPPGQDPCADGRWWMRCLHARGANVVIQTEANPGPWTDYTGGDGGYSGVEGAGGFWQPLTWMNSGWRHVADPTVGFLYNVTPWLVGNLVDIGFDGQAAIFRRDNPRPWPVRHYVGNARLIPGVDPEWAEVFAGPKREFLVLAPWVAGDDPTLSPYLNRERLRSIGRELRAGSGSRLENAYLETAVWADLVPGRPGGLKGRPRPR